MKLPTVREYKIAIFFLFLGFIASCIVFFLLNAHEIWLFKLDNDLEKLQVDIVKIQGKIEGFDKWAEGWNIYKAEIEEALGVIFSRPEEK